MRTRLFAIVPLSIAGLALVGCGSKSEGATDPSALNNPCPPGQFCPQATPTVTTTTTTATPPPAASSAASAATPLPPLGAAAVTPIITAMGQSEAPGAKADGSVIAGQFQEGQTLEGPINIQPGKCYTIVGGSVGIQELHIQLVVQQPPLPAVTLAQDSGSGPSPVLGGKKDGCWKNPTPLGGPGKVILKATKGAGVGGAQVFVK